MEEHRELDDSPSLVLHALEANLRRRSDQRIKIALEVAVLRLAGEKDHEIRERLGLTGPQLQEAMAELRGTIREPA